MLPVAGWRPEGGLELHWAYPKVRIRKWLCYVFGKGARRNKNKRKVLLWESDSTSTQLPVDDFVFLSLSVWLKILGHRDGKYDTGELWKLKGQSLPLQISHYWTADSRNLFLCFETMFNLSTVSVHGVWCCSPLPHLIKLACLQTIKVKKISSQEKCNSKKVIDQRQKRLKTVIKQKCLVNKKYVKKLLSKCKENITYISVTNNLHLGKLLFVGHWGKILRTLWAERVSKEWCPLKGV